MTYEFVDDRGKTIVHEQDLNSSTFFRNLSVGDKIEVLYHKGSTENSYPLSQIGADLKIVKWVSVGILLFWGVMGVILI